jgi:branched-chain amino acid transport system substrate-binding protein
MLVALAAQRAKSTKGVDIASQINGITQGRDRCTTFRQCRDIINRGGSPTTLA